jgi:hypothetical protein
MLMCFITRLSVVRRETGGQHKATNVEETDSAAVTRIRPLHYTQVDSELDVNLFSQYKNCINNIIASNLAVKYLTFLLRISVFYLGLETSYLVFDICCCYYLMFPRFHQNSIQSCTTHTKKNTTLAVLETEYHLRRNTL